MHGYDVCLNAAVSMPKQTAQHGVDCFRVKRRKRIFGIRLETKQSFAALRPVTSGWMLL